MFGFLKALAAASAVLAGSLVATSPAEAGVGYYYSAPSYYYAPPVYYGPSYSYGVGGFPGYGYSPYSYGYYPSYGLSPVYGGYGYGGYPSYGFGFSGNVYRSSGFRPSKFSGGFGLSTLR